MTTVANRFVETLAAVGVKRIYSMLRDRLDNLTDALTYNGLVPIAAAVNPTELAMPASVALEMARDFTLYMVKAASSRRANEVVDLARSKLWR
jgi:pyruvate dehydrogenase (quinone)